jgi:hypothetical protein
VTPDRLRVLLAALDRDDARPAQGQLDRDGAVARAQIEHPEPVERPGPDEIGDGLDKRSDAREALVGLFSEPHAARKDGSEGAGVT